MSKNRVGMKWRRASDPISELRLPEGWRLTVEHSASSYGVPVLVSPDGQAFGVFDYVTAYGGGRLLGWEVVEILYGRISADCGVRDLELVRRFHHNGVAGVAPLRLTEQPPETP